MRDDVIEMPTTDPPLGKRPSSVADMAPTSAGSPQRFDLGDRVVPLAWLNDDGAGKNADVGSADRRGNRVQPHERRDFARVVKLRGITECVALIADAEHVASLSNGEVVLRRAATGDDAKGALNGLYRKHRDRWAAASQTREPDDLAKDITAQRGVATTQRALNWGSCLSLTVSGSHGACCRRLKGPEARRRRTLAMS
jgi:hypothetical protein